MGTVTKEDAVKILASLELKDKSEYVACIQRDIENMLKEVPKPVVEAEVEPTVVEEENKPVFKKQTYRKKHNIQPIEHEVVNTVE